MDDATLVTHILARDRRALSFFYHAYAPKLSRFIASRVADPRDAEEILQDSLFAFLEALRDFQGKSRLQTFLFAIATHKIIDYYRRKKFKQIVFSQLPRLEGLITPFLTPEDALDKRIIEEKIETTLRGILPKYREILVFKYLEGRSVESIAKKLTITFKSAESLLFRARKAFVKVFVSI